MAGFFNTDMGGAFTYKQPGLKARRQIALPEAPALEAPPTRDFGKEAQDRIPGALLASAISLLLSPRRAGGTVASYLKGSQAGADAQFGEKVADVNRTNQAAMAQYGVNQRRYGDERAADNTDYQRDRDVLGDEWRQKGFNRQGNQIEYGRGRDDIADTRYDEGKTFRDNQVKRHNLESDRSWKRSKALQNLQAFQQQGKFLAPFDAKSQVGIGAAAKPLLEKVGVPSFESPVGLVPKPADPSRAINAETAKARETRLSKQQGLNELWRKVNAGVMQSRVDISRGNLGVSKEGLALRQSEEAFSQAMKEYESTGKSDRELQGMAHQADSIGNSLLKTDPSRAIVWKKLSKTLMPDSTEATREAVGAITGLIGAAPLPPKILSPKPQPPSPTVIRKAGQSFTPSPSYTPPSRKLTAEPVINPMAQKGNRGGFAPKKAAPTSSKIAPGEKIKTKSGRTLRVIG